MSDYIVSARKYRPDSFGTLVGQDNIARTLRNSIVRGQLAHAYLFCGPRGVGKTSTARIFAKAINCANPSAEMEPCGECESCRSFAEGRSYCIHELDAASNNGVEDIKVLMEQVQIPPQVGRYSVFIIDEVHMLSQAAFNAFLKTLEEPPSHAIFILCTTEKHKILPTILSRCQTYDFNRISVQDISANLRGIAAKEGVSVDDESLHVIARKADGAMRDALTIFDQTVAFCGTDIRYDDVIRNLNVLDYEYSFRIVDAALCGDYATGMLVFDEILAKGFNAQYFISALGSHLRDLLVCRTGGMDSLLDYPESLRARYAAQAEKCSVKFLYDALSTTTSCEAAYRSSVNQRLLIEFSLMKLAFLSAAPQAPAPAKAAQPVPQPAPQPAPQAAPQPAPRPAPSRLSLGSIVDAGAPAQAPVAAEAHKDVTDEVLLSFWPQLVALYKDKPRLSNALSSSRLSVARSEEGVRTLTFEVSNVSQQAWIQTNLLRSLEKSLRGIAGTEDFNLCVGVTPDEEVKREAYMPEEKARELMDGNPNVKEFVTELKLDVK